MIDDRGHREPFGYVVLQAKFKTCCKTLMAYCRNVHKDLSDESKRSIKRDGKALNERVACMPGGLEFLAEVGFEVRSVGSVALLM